ncbi:MAG TPA: TonB family protein [Burkholderiales bacterium]|nr:TonB family protein [Burkholderiales bacterium]
MTGVLQLDDPWRRLPWSLPLALAICAVILWEFGRILERPPVHQTVPASIEAELVELPPPPVEEKIVRPKPAPQRAKVQAPAPVALPTAPAAPAEQNSVPAPPPVPASAAPAVPAAPDMRSAGAANQGAQAIVRPMPEIPDDLRQEAFNAVAMVRFHISADGTATFELAKPTQNPRLNRLLIEKLREWRFFPAMRDGKPVASDHDVRVTFEVK